MRPTAFDRALASLLTGPLARAAELALNWAAFIGTSARRRLGR